MAIQISSAPSYDISPYHRLILPSRSVSIKVYLDIYKDERLFIQ